VWCVGVEEWGAHGEDVCQARALILLPIAIWSIDRRGGGPLPPPQIWIVSKVRALSSYIQYNTYKLHATSDD